MILGHASDTKYREILKNCMNLLQNIKHNERSYPLDNYVSNHFQKVEYFQECATHITTSVLDQYQQVEYPNYRVLYSDNTLQDEIGLVSATKNNTRYNFEAAASTLIEVDPYKSSQKIPSGPGRQSNISGIEFSGGRGSSVVDLR